MSNTFRPSAPSKNTIIEEGTEFKGTLTSSCPIDVRGRIEGEVTTPALTVSKSGAVHGRAKVASVHSEGELSGEFDADTVELAGSVRDNTVIRARSLQVKLASERGKLQVIFGECELSIGDEPTAHDPVEPPARVSAEPPPEMAAVGLPVPVPPVEPALSSDALSASANAATEGAPETDEPDDAAMADDSPAGTPGKRRRKRKDGAQAETPEVGWSQPPSQPPPAN
jgi:cytoskeletal protein CcmA (bactofilin family)